MTTTLKPKPTQCAKVLEALENANGEYVSGRYFIQNMMLSQFHTRIFELQEKGHNIEASSFKDSYGFKSYKLISKETLF